MTSKNILYLCILCILAFSSTIHAQEYSPGLKSQFTNPATVARQPVSKSGLKAERRGFYRPFGKAFAVSSIAYWSGAVFDNLSSRGLVETNPLARNRDGRISMGKAFAYDAAFYSATVVLERRHPRLAFWVRIIAGGVKSVFGGVHNLRER
jgi:hypothetical protein